MKAITFDTLEKQFGGEALTIYKKICHIGGYGDIGSDFANGFPALDVSGLSEAKQNQIAGLLGEPESETVESLAKQSREKLEERAKTAGLDGNKYTDKKELAKAILEKEAK